MEIRRGADADKCLRDGMERVEECERTGSESVGVSEASRLSAECEERKWSSLA